MSSEHSLLEIKEFPYYIVFMDDKGQYVMAYGYNKKPAVVDMRVAIDTLSTEKDLIAAIPNFHEVMGYICVSIMKYKKFIKYIEDQEENFKGPKQ